MKKKTLNILTLLLMFVPFLVKAETYTYNDAINRANNYINSYGDKGKYIMPPELPFSFKDGNNSVDTNFLQGGFLNKDEYDLGGSYLSPGGGYWTMTPAPNGNIYYITTLLNSDKGSNSKAGVRVTEFVVNGVEVVGSGTKINPWEFVGNYKVSIGSNDENKGTVSPTEKFVKSGESVDFTLHPKTGYGYRRSTCNLKRVGSQKYRLENISSDINCLVIFDNAILRYSLYDANADEQAEPNVLYLEYKNKWYKDEETTEAIEKLTRIPKRKGYTFKGYKSGNTDVIDENGNIISIVEPSDLEDTEKKLLSKWTINNYICEPGTYLPKNSTSCTNCKVGSYCEGGTFNYSVDLDQGIKSCPSGYTSNEGIKAENECHINVEAGKYIATAKSATKTPCAPGTSKAAHTVNYGEVSSCLSCGAGQYADSGSSSCVSCPEGYRDGASAQSQSGCVKKVPGGKYIATAKSNTVSTCAAGTAKGEHTVKYGDTSSCDACAVGEYSSAGASSCSSCPSGYRSGAAATSINGCKMSVPAGNYIKQANDQIPTECSAGYSMGAHSVNYGGTSSCTPCGTGYYSSKGASSCTRCPEGYRDGNGTTSEANCQMSVPGGKYVKTAKDKTSTSCSAGYYRAAHTVNYGGTSSCSQCSAGYYSSAGAATCTQCQSGYTSSAGASTCTKSTPTSCGKGEYMDSGTCKTCPEGYRDGTNASSISGCQMSVPNGKYVKTAKDKTSTSCSAGYYRAAHTVNYGGTSSCSQCSAGYYSSAGATSCTQCPSGKTSSAGASSCTDIPQETNCYKAGSNNIYYKISGCAEVNSQGYGLWEALAYSNSSCSTRASSYDVHFRFETRATCPDHDGFVPMATDRNNNLFSSRLQSCNSTYESCANNIVTCNQNCVTTAQNCANGITGCLQNCTTQATSCASNSVSNTQKCISGCQSQLTSCIANAQASGNYYAAAACSTNAQICTSSCSNSVNCDAQLSNCKNSCGNSNTCNSAMAACQNRCGTSETCEYNLKTCIKNNILYKSDYDGLCNGHWFVANASSTGTDSQKATYYNVEESGNGNFGFKFSFEQLGFNPNVPWHYWEEYCTTDKTYEALMNYFRQYGVYL